MESSIEQPTTRFSWYLINDLSALPGNEDIIIDYLLDRLQRGQIYTWVGSLLLVLNPCNEVSTSDLYTPAEFDKYINISDHTREESTPHIFTMAAKANFNLVQELGRNCQVIVISGETGTGKTFNACKCLEFLSAVNKSPAFLCQGDYAHNIIPRITDACRLVSAFTTACTERNEVSSRHGQLVRLHYKGDSISGATISSFLLERSRVTKGSSNFQIFYQMMFGMSEPEMKAFGLSGSENYDLLNVKDYNKGKHFADGFQDTLQTMEVLGLNEELRKSIFQTLALIIHMGNIQFVENGETCVIDDKSRKSRDALRNTCLLSCLNEETIVELLTTILINPQSTWRKHTSYNRNLTTIDACRNRLYSIIRHIYDLLFHWILDRVNETISVKQQCPQWLGILDIFGFEFFKQNGIEQLCVNYANEKMQQYFMETCLEKSRKDLEEEGFIDNKKPFDILDSYRDRISVLEEALFLTLNDVCQSPVAVNTSTIIQLACGNSRNVHRRFLNEKEGSFVVEHYSGPVAYSIKDLLSKNTDKVPSEISVTFNTSRNQFLRYLIKTDDEIQLSAVKTSTRKKTMLAKLKYSMDTLIKELSKCDLHYVRCVKPSRTSDCKWDRNDLRKQLACTGIFDALPLAKCKYPVRLRYEDFCRRYSKKYTEILDIRKCERILESTVAKRELNSLVHYGKHLIFLTEAIFFKLEFCRRRYRIKCVNQIKSFWMKYRRKKVSPRSKFLTNSCKLRDETPEKDTSLKITLEIASTTPRSSEEDDDVFIRTPIRREENNNNYKEETEILNISAKFGEPIYLETKISSLDRSGVSKKLQHDFENWQRKHTNFNSQCTILSKDYEDYTCESSIDINGNNHNNNNLDHSSTYVSLNNPSSNDESLEKSHEEKQIAHFDKEKNVYTIETGNSTLFYKNRILSRRRLAVIPIRVHTRPNCLINSHMLPRSELPRGLQDCL